MILTTTPNIDGYAITEYKQIVFGEVISGANAFKDMGAGIRNVFGGRAQAYESELTNDRNQAINEMIQNANNIGANAIVGAQFDYEVLGASGNMLMVTASGTAVTIKEKPQN